MVKITLVTGFLFSAACIYAQPGFTDSLQSAGFARRVYDARRGNELPVYTGTQVYPYSSAIDGTAFFQSDDWQKGTVVFDSVVYKSIFMRYDLVKDQLVITPDKEGGIFISLFGARVSSFSYSGATFVRLDKNQGSSPLPDGFYQQLVSGPVTAFAKKSKAIREKLSGSTIDRSFEDNVKYYVLRDGAYHAVRNANDLLGVLKEYKKEVQQYLAAQNLKYRSDPERTIIAAIEFYNQRRG